MKNFIFKSEADFHKIVFNKLDMLLDEQRHQRMDLTTIIRLVTSMKIDKSLQNTVDKYFEEDENFSETSPQTEQKQNGPD